MNSEHKLILTQARSLLAGENDRIANAANLSALVWNNWADISWVGFYFLQADNLILGPFQGQPACTRIALGSGVCGQAAQSGATLRVADVNQFPGHIACDAGSASELVVPLFGAAGVIGVLDIDSYRLDRFDHDDAAFAEALATIFVDSLGQRLERNPH